jgi:hypothetical protein
MRIGVGVHVLGPVSVYGSIGTRRRRRRRPGPASGIMGIAVLVALAIGAIRAWPWLGLFALAAVMAPISFIARKRIKGSPRS